MKKIASKLTLSIGIVTLIFTAFLLYEAYALTDRRIKEVVEQQTSMALQFDLAIRKYVGHKIRPLMYKLVGEDEFIPEAMSTSYVARSIFDEVRGTFPAYILKFSSDNPRNPLNQAGPEELKVIEYLNAHPYLQRWEGEIIIDGKPYMAKFSARRMKEECLRCHGDPKDAPASLLERYGPVAGFHRPMDEIIGSDTVAIPTERISEKLWSESIPVFLMGGVMLLLFFFAILSVIRFTITNRLTMISGHFAETARQEDYSNIEPIKTKGRDEISDLVLSFNTLSHKLKKNYASLDQQVQERTHELENRNRLLALEIQERTRAEKALRESESRYRLLVEQSYQGLVITQDNPLRFSFVSKPMEAITGYTREEMEDFGAQQVLELIHPEDRERFLKNLRRRLEGKEFSGTVEYRILHKTKGTRWIELHASRIKYNDSPATHSVVLDITDKKRAEEALRRSEERLARSKKMESLGLLAGGVAHDLNNVLSGIVSYPELILMDLPKDSKLIKPIKTMEASGNRAAAIVQDLLTVARGVATPKEPMNLNDLIKDYLDSPEFTQLEQFHSDVEIKMDLDKDLFNINGSHVHIRKAVMNLVSNACEAVKGPGNITISTQNRYVDRPLRRYDDVKIGEYVVFKVSDDGPGISPDDLERIFEPFYTKKIMGRSGTGLGLAVVWNVMQDHGGYIDVKSSDDGTTFELYFPITRMDVSDNGLPKSTDRFEGKGETILIVDDEESQREITSNMLDSLGYEPRVVSSGEEAVEFSTNNSVDLVLLDMIMDPGINGLETYERIKRIHPHQKAIIVSGFAETGKVKQAQMLGAGEYIKKPFTMEKLARAVREELEKSRNVAPTNAQ
jgi:two-component system cell cycle sensor histidine kinase/response regulator CckA